MPIRHRLKRLEAAAAAGRKPGQRTFEEWMEDHERLHAWLRERGFPDHLAAIEAGATCPPGLEDLLREQAAYDPMRRTWKRVEAAIKADLPTDADLEFLRRCEQNGGRAP